MTLSSLNNTVFFLSLFSIRYKPGNNSFQLIKVLGSLTSQFSKAPSNAIHYCILLHILNSLVAMIHIL